MPRPLCLAILVCALALTCGCQQARCASDTAVASVGNAWRGVRGAFGSHPAPGGSDCVRVADPVYGNPCGGDNGIGRGGTGAFRVP